MAKTLSSALVSIPSGPPAGSKEYPPLVTVQEGPVPTAHSTVCIHCLMAGSWSLVNSGYRAVTVEPAGGQSAGTDVGLGERHGVVCV